MIWLSLVFNYVGLTAFAAAMESHRRTFPQITTRVPSSVLLVIGALLQVAALGVAISSVGIAVGVVLWVIGWAVCGFVLSMFLSLRSSLWVLPAIILLLISAADRLGRF